MEPKKKRDYSLPIIIVIFLAPYAIGNLIAALNSSQNDSGVAVGILFTYLTLIPLLIVGAIIAGVILSRNKREETPAEGVSRDLPPGR